MKKQQSDIIKVRKELLSKKKKKPKFKRQHWFRHKRIVKAWRKPKGRQSKMRKGKAGRPKKVSIGFSTPKIIKGLHPSGYEDILVHNLNELEALNAETQAARFIKSMGRKKRIELIKKAEEKGVKILNPRIK